jgi:hypothetical protein
VRRSGASRDRTGDLLLAKQALSQLSYGPEETEFREVSPGARGNRASGLEQTPTARELFVEVEIARGLLLEPQALLLGRVAKEVRRLLQHVLGDRLLAVTHIYRGYFR